MYRCNHLDWNILQYTTNIISAVFVDDKCSVVEEVNMLPYITTNIKLCLRLKFLCSLLKTNTNILLPTLNYRWVKVYVVGIHLFFFLQFLLVPFRMYCLDKMLFIVVVNFHCYQSSTSFIISSIAVFQNMTCKVWSKMK